MTDQCQRLFFALWPEQSQRQRIASAYRGLDGLSTLGRSVPIANLHLTLHFLGNIPSARVGCFQQQARQVRAPAFELVLDRSGHFDKARVLWLGCKQVPAELLQLQQRLGEGLRGCGFQPEARRYRPHVTLARKVKGAVDSIPIEPISWHIDRFVLMESVSSVAGVRYQVLDSYPLLQA